MFRFLQILVFVILVSTAQGRAAKSKTGKGKIAEKPNGIGVIHHGKANTAKIRLPTKLDPRTASGYANPRTGPVCPEGADVCVSSDNLCSGHGMCCFKGNEKTSRFCVCYSPWKGQFCQNPPSYKADECPLGFTYVYWTEKCYKVIWEALDWYSAAKKCDEAGPGSYLVAITSAEENRQVKTVLTTAISRNLGSTACLINGNTEWGPMYWTSGQQLWKRNCKSPFEWKQSSDKLTAFDYTNWNGGEPNCGTKEELCVGIVAYNGFRWDDILCSRKICSLCEYTP